MSNISNLVRACVRPRTAVAIISRHQSKIPLMFARSLSTDKPNKPDSSTAVAMPKRWSQKHERILYNTVTTEYLENEKEIDWEGVSSRVGTFSKDLCKTRFYQLQRQLADRTSSKSSIWTRLEIERLVTGAYKADVERLKRSDANWRLDWNDLATKFSNKRSPDECKRIYNSYRHLCKVDIGWDRYRPAASFLTALAGITAIMFGYSHVVDWLYDYFDDEGNSADL
ncbi:hypothetical protein EV175_000164 [Coemansia sp. RSA 1933]|nr:hypothetical protein EV175_000164 [Coemansia sp. RSA 1933]